VKKAKKSARLSGNVDTGRFPVTSRNAVEGIQNGTYKTMFSNILTAGI
jgi:hypothetical protein